jgi:hemoglobin-like flavoprotein
MTPEQVSLVQSSWQQVVPIKDQAAQLFYQKLFELDPKLKTLFKNDMAEQRRKLMNMLDTAVRGLKNPDAIVPAVRDLGKRHVGYGVKDKDYDTVATALLWTLEKGLGAGFTAETRNAWIAAYGLLTSVMKQPSDAIQPAKV